MAKTIIVFGYGTGISSAVAERFAREGFALALVARNAERLSKAADALRAKGARAEAFPADLGDPAAARAVVGKIRASMGPINALHWNAYGGAAGDLLAADTAAVHAALDIATASLLAVVQEALPDLRKEKDSAVLVTNGGFGYFDAAVDASAVQFNAMGLALANAAKHKLVGLLAQKLKPEGVYVGEVMVVGLVKGTAWDQGNAQLDPAAIGERFWQLYGARSETYSQFSG
jgi:short-subunit dehydrogenase